MRSRNVKVLAAAAAASLVALSSGCSTSDKVQAKQIGDREMDCRQLRQELDRMDVAQQKVDDNRGMTGTNVASALFWLPGLAYTYYDASQADDLISERRSWLSQLYDEHKCTVSTS